MLKLVIFDMDGLMLDTEQLYLRAFSDTCVSYGIKPQNEIYYKTIGADEEGDKILYQAAFAHVDATEFYATIQVHCAELVQAGCYSVKPGLFELFDAIERKGGIQKAVVTSNLEEPAMSMLTTVGIMPHLNGGVYRGMVSRAKPFPDSHLLCCQMFNANPKEALVLEDSEFGIRAALAAGIPVIAIPDLTEPSAEVLTQCIARCNSLFDVIPLL